MRTAAGERQGEKKCPGNKTVCTIRSGAAEHRCEEPSCMKAGAGHWAGSAHSTAQHSTAQRRGRRGPPAHPAPLRDPPAAGCCVVAVGSWPCGAGTEGLHAACAALVLWFSLPLGSLVCRLAVHGLACAQGFRLRGLARPSAQGTMHCMAAIWGRLRDALGWQEPNAGAVCLE